MGSINHQVDTTAINDSSKQQQMQEQPIMSEEKSSAAPMASSEKAMFAAEIILPDDDADAIHSRHTFSSRQKIQEVAAQRRNKSSSNKQQQRNKNNSNVVGIISPLADGTNVVWRQGLEPTTRKCTTNNNDASGKNNSDMKWTTIGNKKMISTQQELDKLTSWISQPVSSECSVEEEDDEQLQITMVSPEPVSHQNQQHQQLSLANNFKTPKKTIPNETSSSSVAETPITQLFNYYNFTNSNNNNNSSTAKENIKPISPITSFMLQTSPFKSSGKILDDQLQSVLKAERSMDEKIERMMLENDLDNDSYMDSPMSSLNNSDSSGEDDEDVNESMDNIKSKSRNESMMSTISDDAAISELSDEADTKSDVEFLTPKSHLVINNRGQRTAATAYYTARNSDVHGDNERGEGTEERSSRMYDSDSESYSVRRMDVLQQHQQQQQRPRSASCDAVRSIATMRDDTNAHVALEKVRRNSMSPPTEFRTTRVLWSDDTTPPVKAVALLNWEFDAENKISNKRALSSTNNDVKPQTVDVEASTPLVPDQLYNRGSSKLQLGRIREERNAESVQSNSQLSSKRDELLNVINVMRIKLTQLESERDSLVVERDAHAKDCNEYKEEKEVLSAQVTTLEQEVHISLQMVENVKETLTSRVDETDCLKQLLHKRETDLDSLKATLLSKEGEVQELSSALKGEEDDFEARLQSAEKERLSEVARVTADLKQVHSEAIDKVKFDLQAAHSSELDRTRATLVKDFEGKASEVMAAHALEVKQMQVSSLEEVVRVRGEAEKDRLAAISQEIASITERLNTSQVEAITELQTSHKTELQQIHDASQSESDRMRNENDDLITQTLLLTETNEGLMKTLSTQEEEQRHAQEVAREREMASTDKCNEVEAMLQESDANLALLRDDNKVLGETVANLTKSLDAKHTDFEGAVQEKDAILVETKRQLLDSKADIDSIMLANTALESKYAALLEENALLKQSNSSLNEANVTLQTSLGDVSDNLSDALKEKEKLMISLGDAKDNIQSLEDRLSSVDSELFSKIQRIEEVCEEKNEVSQRENDYSTQIKRLQSDVASANKDNAKMTIELDALACLEMEIRGQLEASDDEKITLRDEIAELQSGLSEANMDRVNLPHEFQDLSSLRDEMFENSHSNETRISELESENRALSRVKHILQLKSDKIESLNASATAKIDEGNNKMTRLREENDAVNAELDQVKSKLQFVSEKASNLAAEKADVEVHLKSFQNERDDLQRKYNEALLSCETMLLTLESSRMQIQLNSDEIESINASSTAKFDEVNKTMDALREENVAAKAELEELQSQLQSESKKMANLVLEKSSTEVQLSSTQKDRDDLQQKFDEAVVSCESMLLSLGDARSEIQVKTVQVQELEVQLATKHDEYACEKAEYLSSFKRLQAVAANLAVNVLQLKFKGKHELKRNENITTELKVKNERITYLETCLDELRNDTVTEQNLKLTVAKLASALIKLKVRERRAVAVQKRLSGKNIDLLAKLGVMTKENEGMDEGMTALTDKITSLELDLESKDNAMADLQKDASVKYAEVKRLSDLLAGKDDALKDVTNEIQKIRSDVTNGVKKLELEHASAIKGRSRLEEDLAGMNSQLSRERELVFNLQSQLEQVISEKNDIEDDMVDLQGSQLHLENHLEQVSQDRTHLKSQIEDMHDSIAAFEADKDSLTKKLEEFHEQADHLTKKIGSLEADAKSNARQIDYMEFQLVSKMDESEAFNKMVVSHEATLKDLSDEIEAMDAKKTEIEESLSSLHSKMDEVINERDGLASQLQYAAKELESVRAEWEKVRSGTELSHTPIPSPTKLDSSLDVDNFASSPGHGIRKILESSKISREDIDFICSNIDKSKAIITEIGKERKTLKKEVKRLRADLEQAQGELQAVKKNCKVMNQQTIELRGDVNQAKSLLKEHETEKNQLASDLEAAHEAMDQIQKSSSESYNSLVQQSQLQISMLQSELESKDEAIDRLHALRNDHISKYDITSDSIQSSQQPSEVTSVERFKVEKGQSMFGLLKGKRTKRKGTDQLSYRQRK